MYREATLADCDEIYDLVCELEGTALPRERFFAIFQKHLLDKCRRCLVWEENRSVAGVLTLRFEDQLHHKEPVAEIMEFVLAPAFRDRGIGAKLFVYACELAKDFGCGQLELSSGNARTKAHRFYLRQGMDLSHVRFTMSLADGLEPKKE